MSIFGVWLFVGFVNSGSLTYLFKTLYVSYLIKSRYFSLFYDYICYTDLECLWFIFFFSLWFSIYILMYEILK